MSKRASLFVSHISEESDVALLLRSMLEKDFLGLVKFFTSSDIGSIGAGQDWLVAIQKALDEAALVLVLCSRASVQRPWVQFEVGAAWMKGIPIVPVCHSGLTVPELQMPLSLRQGIELGNPLGLGRLYAAVAKELEIAQPELTDLPARLARVAKVEERFRCSRTQQFERYFDVVIPAPGRLDGDTLPDDAAVHSDPGTLQLFGLGEASWRWKDIVRAARRTPDTRWLAQLQRTIRLASQNEAFQPVQAIYHSERGSYQPQLARREVAADGESRFHVHLVETVVAPLSDVQNDFGLLATLLRLGLRFRYEVIERARRPAQVAGRTGPEPHEDLLKRLRCSVEVIENDALSRGAQNFDPEAVLALFDREDDQDEIALVQQEWDTARAALFRTDPDPGADEVEAVLGAMRQLNYTFMRLGTRRFHEMVAQAWNPERGRRIGARTRRAPPAPAAARSPRPNVRPA
jgi:hypothetical protein